MAKAWGDINVGQMLPAHLFLSNDLFIVELFLTGTLSYSDGGAVPSV
jgi:hypothetical protein